MYKSIKKEKRNNTVKRFYPYLKYNNIYEIDLDLMKNIGIKAFILDIDNTLTKPHTETGDSYAKDFILKLKENGFSVCIVSNNIYARAEKFANSVDCDFVCDGNKPSKRPFLKALEILKTEATAVAVVGDQIFTDIWGANRMGMKGILVNPICDEEENFVKFKRIFEKLVIKGWKVNE